MIMLNRVCCRGCQKIILATILILWTLSCSKSSYSSNEKIMKAIIKNDINKLNSILEKENVNIDNTFKVKINDYIIEMTPLNLSSQIGNYEIAKLLIENGADVNMGSYFGMTPLMSASQGGYLEIAQILYESGADIYAEDESGRNSLMLASQFGNLEMVKFLIENGAEIDAKDNSGDTALKWASLLLLGNRLDIVKYLVESGADINSRNSVGMTALMWASSIGNLEVVKYLIENGANVNIGNRNGTTALGFAQNESIKNILIEAGAINDLYSGEKPNTKSRTIRDKTIDIATE